MTTPIIQPTTYASWRATTLGASTERVENDLVFELAGPLAGKRVLDVGTGDGTYAIEAAKRGAQVTGIDVEPTMLAAGRARAAEQRVEVSFERGQAQALPFADGSFDVVLAVTVLCFVPDARAAVREMARVLAPDGRIVLGELARLSVWAASRRVRGWLGSSTWRRAKFWSESELEHLAGPAGLRVLAVRGAVYFPPVDFAARLMAPIEPWLSRHRAPGAAFLALAAAKPESCTNRH